jgi:hypothetical protein
MRNSKKFSELDKVRAQPPFEKFEGYVIGSMFKDGRWIYKVSFADGKTETFDNWMPESSLEKIQ